MFFEDACRYVQKRRDAKAKHNNPRYNSSDSFRYRAFTQVQLNHRSQSLDSLLIWKS
jgi:hypothetical protein